MQQTRSYQAKLSPKSTQSRMKRRSFAATWDESDEDGSYSTGSESEKANLCLRGDITDGDDDEPSEVSKLTHSKLLIYFHHVNGCFERHMKKYAKIEPQRDIDIFK